MEFFNTGNIPADLAKRSFAANIARVMPTGSAPLFALSGLAKEKIAKQIEHGYWTKSMEFKKIELGAAVDTAGASTLAVTNTSGLIPNQVIRFPRPFASGAYQAPELMLISSVDHGAGTVDVIRGFAGTTPLASIAAGTKAAVPFNAYPEGSPRPISRAIVPKRVTNYTQIFRNAWSQNRTLAATMMEVGKGTVAENKMDAAGFHAQEIEYATLFGRKYLGTDPSSGEPIHTMNGLEAMIEAEAPHNIKEAGTTTTYDQLEELLDSTLDFKTDFMSGNERSLFVGKGALKTINNVGRLSGEYELKDGQTNFGLSFRTFQTTRGKFNLIEHPLLNANEDYENMAFVVDLSSFDFCYLEGRNTQYEYINKNMESTDGRDADGGVITSELTIEMMNPFACGVIYGLRSAAA